MTRSSRPVRRPARLLAALVALALTAASCTDDDAGGIRSDGGFFSQLGPASTTTAPPTTAGDGSADTTVPEPDDGLVLEIRWAGSGRFQEGVLEVPLDHDDPSGATIELALLRIEANDPDRRVGSLLVNPGGPGGSGIELASVAPFFMGSEVLDRFDIIGWDPRGVGRSTAVTCGDGPFLDRWAAADPLPADPAEQAANEALMQEFVDRCVAESGDLLPHVSTVDSARDMDLIRRALGEERLTYLGFSYGTRLGATYAELFPERVRAFVLDGAYSRSLSSAELTEQQALGFERSLDEFLDWCRERRCRFAGPDDPRDALEEVFATITATPLPTRDADRPLTVGLAHTGLILTLYSSSSWPTLAQALAEARLDGTGNELLRLADQYNGRSADGTWDNSTAAFVAINCADHAPLPPAELAAVAERLRVDAPWFGPLFTSGDSCARWPVAAVDDTSPFRAAGAPPILVIATTGDPATPYEWGVQLAEELETGVLVTYVGEVHTAYGEGDACVDEAVERYLIDLVVPPDGLVCG